MVAGGRGGHAGAAVCVAGVLGLVLGLVLAGHLRAGDGAADRRAVGQLDGQHAARERRDRAGVLAPVDDAVAVGVATHRVVAGLDLGPVLEPVAVAVGLARVRAALELGAVGQPVVIRISAALLGVQGEVMTGLPAVR